TKSCEKWKKVWSDFKNNTKKKAVRVHRASSGTGPAVYAKLTDLELRVLKMMGVQVAKGSQVEKAGLSQVTDKQPNVSVGNDLVTPQPRQSVELFQDDEAASTQSTSSEPEQVSRASSPLIIIIKEEDQSSQPETTEPETRTETVETFPQEETQFEKTGLNIPTRPVVRPHIEPTRSQIPRARLSYSRLLRRHNRLNVSQSIQQYVQTQEFWRKFKMEQHKDDLNLQRERNRIRELELQVQTQWQDLASRALDILDKLVSKNCKD
ncbi:unnamed protein product, partial [Colias eurytheme]